MSKLRRKTEDSDDGANWMTTYSDLVTLLLTFFVLLFSMATIDNQKYEEIRRSLRSSFLNISGGDMYEHNRGKDIFTIIEQTYPKDTPPEYEDEGKEEGGDSSEELINKANELIVQRAEAVRKEMEQVISRLGLSEYISVVREQHNVVFRIDSVVLFDLGKADIKESGKEVLDRFSGLLSEIGNDVLIQGHADDLPINTLLFPSNWELSTKRATNVVLYLVENCGIPPERLTATGNAEYRPIKPNDSPENRQANRRIDIVISGEYFKEE